MGSDITRSELAALFDVTESIRSPLIVISLILHRDTFGGAMGSDITRSELAALFDVIGTPSWADAEAVSTPAWRHYLQVGAAY